LSLPSDKLNSVDGFTRDSPDSSAASFANLRRFRVSGKATIVVFWKQMHKNEFGDAESDGANQSDGHERRARARFVARGYCVFNA